MRSVGRFKMCCKCRKLKILAAFVKHNGKADKLSPECKDCRKVFMKAYVQRAKEKPFLKENQQLYHDYRKSQNNREKLSNTIDVTDLKGTRLP